MKRKRVRKFVSSFVGRQHCTFTVLSPSPSPSPARNQPNPSFLAYWFAFTFISCSCVARRKLTLPLLHMYMYLSVSICAIAIAIVHRSIDPWIDWLIYPLIHWLIDITLLALALVATSDYRYDYDHHDDHRTYEYSKGKWIHLLTRLLAYLSYLLAQLIRV